MTAILEFMYAGEVNVAQDQLPQFLKTAEKLKVGTSLISQFALPLANAKTPVAKNQFDLLMLV